MTLQIVNALSMCALTVAAITGCTSSPTFGDKVSAHGQVTKDLGNNWNRGESMVKKGTKLRKESDGLAKKSSDKQAESEKLLSQCKKLMQESEVAYQSQFGTSMK